MLLPYLEQTPLYNAANFNWAAATTVAQADAINSTVYNTRIASFLCPSDGRDRRRQQNINSYQGSIGTSTMHIRRTATRPGIFQSITARTRGSVTLAEVTDGTSNTIAFGEGLVGDLQQE